MTKLHPIAMLIACIFINKVVSAQDSLSRVGKVLSFPTRFVEKVDKRSSQIEDKIIAHSERVLIKLSREEKRLQRKIYRKDPVLARQLFQDVEGQYKSLRSKLANKANTIGAGNGKEQQHKWYDYDARMYDPQTGRYFKQDRFAG